MYMYLQRPRDDDRCQRAPALDAEGANSTPHTPVVDSERVAHVRENINSGNHIISAERIAEKFSRYESLLEAAS